MTTRKPFSWIKGYSFSFEDEGHHIDAWFSSFSGLEKIFVDGKLVSSQRNYSTNSSNLFRVGENEYSTSLQVKNLFKGPFVCTLNKNGKNFKRQRLVFPRAANLNKEVPFVLKLLFLVLLGIIFGISKAYFDLPDASTYIFLAIIFVAVLGYEYKSRKNKITKPFIEDEKLV